MANLLDLCIKMHQNATAQKPCSSGKGLKGNNKKSVDAITKI